MCKTHFSVRIAVLAIHIGCSISLVSTSCDASPYKEWNAIGIDRKNKILLVGNWPLGSTESIISLQIPLQYVMTPHSETMLFEEYTAALKTKDFTYFNQPIIIDARLPSLMPFTERHSAAQNADMQDNKIAIYFAPTAKSEYKGEYMINELYDFNKSFVVPKWQIEKYSLKYESKHTRFGLARMGPVGNFEPFKKDLAVNDLYYSPTTPKSVVLICPAEEIADAIDEPGWSQRPICTHYFFSNNLKALVKLTYRRIHLHDWKFIQDTTSQLLNTFKKSKKSGG